MQNVSNCEGMNSFSCFELKLALVGCWKVFGYVLKLGRDAAGKLGTSAVQNITSTIWIRYDSWPVVEKLFVRPLICSADLIKKDYPSYNKETRSASYCDFSPVTFLAVINQEYLSKKRWVMLFEGNLVYPVGMTFFKQVRAITTHHQLRVPEASVSFERALLPRESRKHILLVLWWINVCHELSITYCRKLLVLHRACCVVEALTLWNIYFWFMGLLCSGGNPLAELLSCHWRADGFHASELCYSFTHHSCPLSEVILRWQNFQFDKLGSQSCSSASLGLLEECEFVLEDVAREQCRKKQHLSLCIFSNLQNK